MSAITRQLFEDIENLPPQLQQETLDFVEFLKQKQQKAQAETPKQEPNGTKLAELMAEIAARGTAFKDIEDPAAWQREIRKDRPLTGREE